jgi:hypothetical protein
MSPLETLYLVLVLVAFGGFAATLAFHSQRS